MPNITFDNLKRIDPSLPYPITGYLKHVRDNYYCPAAAQMSTCTCLSLKEMTSDHMDDYVPLAEKALDHFNGTQHANLSFVKVTVATYQCGPEIKVHLNFIASSEDGMEILLFAELVGSLHKLTSEYLVKGCCVLQKIDSENPIGWGCDMCGEEIIHPGPRHGCMIVAGDLFKDYPFWDYRITPRNDEPTCDDDDQKMYLACAMKAVEYFNSTEFWDFDFDAPEVTVGSFTNPCPHKTLVHVNFKCSSSMIDEQLFFAELVVPTFATIDDGVWDTRKEPFIEVKGCCMLELMHAGMTFGRDCKVCYYGCGCSEVIHPGPKHGYHAALGDDFTSYEFTRIGHGIY